MTRRLLVTAFGLLVLAAGGPASAQDGSDVSVGIGGAVRLAIDARIAVDAAASGAGDSDEDRTGAVDLARQRIGVDGRVGTRVEFEIERELGGDGGWRDAFADYRVHPSLRVRAGRFKVPFSLEATTGAAHLDFVNRSRAVTALAPGRDDGVMARGRLWGKHLEHETGLFRHDGEGVSAHHPERTYGTAAVASRLTVRPFASSKRSVTDLRVALAIADARIDEGVSNLRGHTLTGDAFFPAAYWVAGRRHRTGVEARWHPGPLTLTAEYIRAADDRRGQGVGGDDLPPLAGSGWYLAGVWRVPRSVIPWRSLRVETAARVEALEFRSAGGTGLASTNPRAERIAPADDRAVTLGMNVWVTRHVKVLVDAVHERVYPSDPFAPPAPASWTPVISVRLAL